MNETTSINSIYPNLQVPTKGLLQGLTVMQQCVYQMKFKNVCEVKKRLVQPGLVWSRTLYDNAVNEWRKRMEKECLCSHSGPRLQAILLPAVEKWTTELISHSVRNVNKMCFYASC